MNMGMGWVPAGATRQNMTPIKKNVGDRIHIQASGGAHGLATGLEPCERGARRVGIELRHALTMPEECQALSAGSVWAQEFYAARDHGKHDHCIRPWNGWEQSLLV